MPKTTAWTWPANALWPVSYTHLGFFGTLNWKWLVAIIIGLVVIALTAGIINYMVDSDVITDEMITDSLISANDNQK